MEKICILMPVYNSERYLEECLDSILSQTFSNFKVIIVDDGSTDGSGSICDKFMAADSRFYVVHTQNKGAGSARNRAIDEAMKQSVEYIAWVDSDDKLHPEYLEQLYTAAKLHTDCDIVQCDYSNEEKLVDGVKNNDVTISSSEELLCMMEEKTSFRVLWNKLYRKSLFSNVYVRNDDVVTGKINNDVNILWRIYTESMGCYWFHSCLYFYRIVEGSIQHRKQTTILLESFELYRWRYLSLKSDPKYSNYVKLLKEKCLFDFAYQLRLPKKSYLSYSEFYKAIKEKYKSLKADINFKCKRVDLKLLSFLGNHCFYIFRIYGRLYYFLKSGE